MNDSTLLKPNILKQLNSILQKMKLKIEVTICNITMTLDEINQVLFQYEYLVILE